MPEEIPSSAFSQEKDKKQKPKQKTAIFDVLVCFHK